MTSTTDSQQLAVKPPSVFLSYARADDEDGFVRSLFEALSDKGFDVWWDKVSMPSRGLTFLNEIAEAIDAADRVLLVLSPTAAASDYVRAEWQYALFGDKVVTPVLRRGDFGVLPPELKGTHCEDVRATRDARNSLDAVLRLAADPAPPLAGAASVPVPPPHYRPRPAQFSRVTDLLALDRPDRLAVPPERRTFLLHGMGGVGKSVLAAAVARSTATRRAFSDAVIWVPAGPDARPLAVLQQIARGLGEEIAHYGTMLGAREALHRRLANAAVLIVLDNVWGAAPIEPVREVLGPRCRLLLTAREPGIMETGTEIVDVEPFSMEEAVAYLGERARSEGCETGPAMVEVARECGRLPFALALAGAMIASTSWDVLLQRLKAADLSFMTARIPGYPYADLLRALQVSVEQLRRDPEGGLAVDRYLEISAFRWEAGVPETAVATVWRAAAGLPAPAAQAALTLLARRGLVRTEGRAPARLVRLHDLQQDYLRAVADDPTREHARILDAYAHFDDTAPLVAHDDGYYLDNCFHHLEGAGRADEMHDILSSESAGGGNAWWETRLAHGQVLGFVTDVRRAWDHAWRDVAPGRPPDASAVARSVRYALMVGSARAAVSGAPLALVNRLLEANLWSAEQAVAVFEWAHRGSGLIDVLAAVFPYLPDERKREAIEEALQVARGQPEAGDTARQLMQIVPLLDGAHADVVLDEALGHIARANVDNLLDAYRAVPGRRDFLDRAIEAAWEADGFSRRRVIVGLAEVLPEDRIYELVPLVDGAGTDESRGEALIALAARATGEARETLASQAFALLKDGENFMGAGVTAVKERARVVHLLPPAERATAALGVIMDIDRLTRAVDRLAAIVDVLPFLTGAARTRAEAQAYELGLDLSASDAARFVSEDRRGPRVAEQAPGILRPLLSVWLKKARRVESYGRVPVIASLLPLLDDDRAREILETEDRRCRLVDDVIERAQCIAALAHIAGEAGKALVGLSLRAIVDDADRAPPGRALMALAGIATPEQLDTIEAALPRVDEFDRGLVAAAVVAGNARLARWDRMLAAYDLLETPYETEVALRAIAVDVPADVAQFIIGQAMEDPHMAAAVVPSLADHLSDEERPFAYEIGLQSAAVLEPRHDRFSLLARLAGGMPCDRLGDATALIPANDGWATAERDRALVKLAVRLADCGRLAASLDVIGRTTYSDDRCRAVAGVSRFYDEPVRGNLLETAETLADATTGDTRVELLVEVARWQREPHRTRLVHKALALARGIDEVPYSSVDEAIARALTTVAPMLDPAEQTPIVLEAWAHASRGGGLQPAQTLAALAPLIAKLSPAAIAEPWCEQLDRVAAARNKTLERLTALAPVIIGLAGSDGVTAVLQSVEEVTRWWP